MIHLQKSDPNNNSEFRECHSPTMQYLFDLPSLVPDGLFKVDREVTHTANHGINIVWMNKMNLRNLTKIKLQTIISTGDTVEMAISPIWLK
jgi:hypothetical protein